MGRCKPQPAQHVMALGASLLGNSPVPLIGSANNVMVRFHGARIAATAGLNYTPELEEII